MQDLGPVERSAASRREDEADELRSVLASALFSRAPSLARLLGYLCQKHFQGEAHLIREQQIAVEVLGRPEPFDQKRDSIVRVELHRLRKRLQHYYSAEGAAHAVQISIPSGGYAPRFAVRRSEPAPPDANPASAERPPTAAETARRRFHWRTIAALFGL